MEVVLSCVVVVEELCEDIVFTHPVNTVGISVGPLRNTATLAPIRMFGLVLQFFVFTIDKRFPI